MTTTTTATATTATTASTVVTTTTATTGIPRGWDTNPALINNNDADADGDDEVVYRQGKDGKWYTYQDLSIANRIFWQRRFELEKIQEAYQSAKSKEQQQQQQQEARRRSSKKRASTTTSTTTTTGPPRPPRRSRRLSDDNKNNNDDDDATMSHQIEGEWLEAPVKKQRQRIPAAAATSTTTTSLSHEDRQKLSASNNNNDWLDGLQDYLTTIDPVSAANCRMVMRQITKLALGEGITYHHWNKNNNVIVFCHNVRIDLSTDLDQLYEQAIAFEDNHGRDLGNGWLLRHPITKLQKYQHYCHEQRQQQPPSH